MLQACVRSGKGLAERLADIKLYPQTLVNVRVQPGQDWTTNQLLQSTIAQAQQALGQTGRVLIRPSGTEPLLRVMVEAQQAELANHWAQTLAKAAQTA